jgi:hypothetical protein
MVDRLLLLAAVNMPPAPSTRGVAQRLAVTNEEAEFALHEAKRFDLVVEEQIHGRVHAPAQRRQLWRLKEKGRAEMYRLLGTGGLSQRAATADRTRDLARQSP